MHIDLSGKTAFVSGSTAGIGLAIAKGLARAGAEVYVNGRSQERVDAAIREIKSVFQGAKVKGIAQDAGTQAGAAKIVTALPEVDILINNLGIFEPKPFFEIPDEDWMRFFEVNVLSGVRLSRAYTQKMVKKGWGRVIFISSESAVQIPTEMIHYGTTKTAQISVARGLAETVAGSGVTVNTVMPGPTRSEGVEGFLKDLAKQGNTTEAQIEKDFFKNVRPTSLLQRFETTEEIANMVVYLSSQEASGTTGAALRVDGGVARNII